MLLLPFAVFWVNLAKLSLSSGSIWEWLDWCHLKAQLCWTFKIALSRGWLNTSWHLRAQLRPFTRMTFPFNLGLSQPAGWILRRNVPSANILRDRKQQLLNKLSGGVVLLPPRLNYDIHEPCTLLLSWAPSFVKQTKWNTYNFFYDGVDRKMNSQTFFLNLSVHFKIDFRRNENIFMGP